MTNTCTWVSGLAWEFSSSLQLAGLLCIQLLVSRHFTYRTGCHASALLVTADSLQSAVLMISCRCCHCLEGAAIAWKDI